MRSTEKGRFVKRKPLNRSLKATLATVALVSLTTLSLAPGKSDQSIQLPSSPLTYPYIDRIVSNSRNGSDSTSRTSYGRAEPVIDWINYLISCLDAASCYEPDDLSFQSGNTVNDEYHEHPFSFVSILDLPGLFTFRI